MEFYILGTASGVPTSHRYCSAIAVKTERSVWLMECAEPTSGQLPRMGLQPQHVDGVFISHFHADHVSGLPMLVQVCQLRGRKSPLTIYAPDKPVTRIWNLLNSLYLNEELLPFHIQIEEVLLKPHFKVLETDMMQVESLPGLHDVPTVAYAFYLEMKKIVFSGDTKVNGDMVDFSKGADLLIFEASHNRIEEIGRFAQQVGSKELLITHIHPHLDVEDVKIEAQIRQYYKGGITIARDLLKIEL